MMKRRDKLEGGGIFKIFERKKKPQVGGEIPPKTIRHLERPVNLPFLKDMDEGKEQYGSAEDMEEKWGLSGKQATLGGVKKRKFISLAIAVAAFILLIVGVFYILPRVLPDLFKGTNIELFVEPVINLEYEDESFRVVKDSTVALMSEPDPSTTRIAEVLYNEPVKYVSSAKNGYCRIQTMDGLTGFVKETSLVADTDSIEPDIHQFKLPGGDTGWIGSSGVIELPPRAETEEVSSRYFVSSVLTFVNSRYIQNGMSIEGASVNGVVYVSAEVNGIQIPRTMEDQAKAGTEIIPQPDAVTGKIMIDQILPGDIIFLSDPKDPSDKNIYEMAVCTDTGTLFMISPARTTVRLRNFSSGDAICERIITIRRLFSSKVT